MANIELARAYVTIVPSMEGAQQAITDGLTGATDAWTFVTAAADES